MCFSVCPSVCLSMCWCVLTQSFCGVYEKTYVLKFQTKTVFIGVDQYKFRVNNTCVIQSLNTRFVDEVKSLGNPEGPFGVPSPHRPTCLPRRTLYFVKEHTQTQSVHIKESIFYKILGLIILKYISTYVFECVTYTSLISCSFITT